MHQYLTAMHSLDVWHWNWNLPQTDDADDDDGDFVVTCVLDTSDRRTPSGGIVDVVDGRAMSSDDLIDIIEYDRMNEKNTLIGYLLLIWARTF